ncbi:MAG: ribbon-helix-helix protein, CopG family [Candidatus Marinimicrobia bacterium]|nr:ribbon-helix-helix protein, CopG family [Candidatus Neomarinimicrobiota bacterium]
MSTTVTVRLRDEIAKLLDEIARDTERSRSFHIQKAVIAYLEEFADAQVALDRLRDKKDTIITAQEMRKVLGL